MARMNDETIIARFRELFAGMPATQRIRILERLRGIDEGLDSRERAALPIETADEGEQLPLGETRP